MTTRCAGTPTTFRVVMPIYYFLPVMGGAEQQACRLGGELMRQGHEVVIVTGRWKREWLPAEKVSGVPVRRLATLWPALDRIGGFCFRHLAFMVTLAWYLVRNRRNYDVIHVHQALHAAFVCSVVAPLIGKPVLVKIGCSGVNGDIRIMREKIVSRVSGWFWRKIRNCDRFVAISREIEQELLEDGVEPARILRLPNGIDGAGYPLKEYRGYRSPLRLISVGRLDPQKAYDVLIEALSLVPDLDLELRVYGTGKDREELASVIRRRGLQDRVFLEGVVHDLPRRLPEGDIFILVSRAEGLSNALMEAMLCGVPCIVSAVGGNTDLVDPEAVEAEVEEGGFRVASNGILVNSDDPQGTAAAVRFLAGNRELSERLGRNASHWMRNHNLLSRVADGYVALYRELMQRNEEQRTS